MGTPAFMEKDLEEWPLRKLSFESVQKYHSISIWEEDQSCQELSRFPKQQHDFHNSYRNIGGLFHQQLLTHQ